MLSPLKTARSYIKSEATADESLPLLFISTKKYVA